MNNPKEKKHGNKEDKKKHKKEKKSKKEKERKETEKTLQQLRETEKTLQQLRDEKGQLQKEITVLRLEAKKNLEVAQQEAQRLLYQQLAYTANLEKEVERLREVNAAARQVIEGCLASQLEDKERHQKEIEQIMEAANAARITAEEERQRHERQQKEANEAALAAQERLQKEIQRKEEVNAQLQQLELQLKAAEELRRQSDSLQKAAEEALLGHERLLRQEPWLPYPEASVFLHFGKQSLQVNDKARTVIKGENSSSFIMRTDLRRHGQFTLFYAPLNSYVVMDKDGLASLQERKPEQNGDQIWWKIVKKNGKVFVSSTAISNEKNLSIEEFNIIIKDDSRISTWLRSDNYLGIKTLDNQPPTLDNTQTEPRYNTQWVCEIGCVAEDRCIRFSQWLDDDKRYWLTHHTGQETTLLEQTTPGSVWTYKLMEQRLSFEQVLLPDCKTAPHLWSLVPVPAHVIVLMLENRSFDSLLGDLHDGGLKGLDASKFENEGDKGQKRTPSPFTDEEIDKWSTLVWALPIDPGHEVDRVETQLKGDMKGFLKDYNIECSHYSLSQLAPLVLKYHTAKTLPILYCLAKSYTLCTNWFSSIPGPTYPNRYFVHSGQSTTTTNPMIDAVSSALQAGLTKYFVSQTQDTVYCRLTENFTSWGLYYHDTCQAQVMTKLNTWGIPAGCRRTKFENFGADLQSHKLPSYVFLEPKYYGQGTNDMHPPRDVRPGEALIANVYDAIKKSYYWEKSLLLITFDEHGGFFDHVNPPSIKPNVKLGVRVPTILISPYVANTSDSTIYEHSSIPHSVIDLFAWKKQSSDKYYYLTDRAKDASSFLGALRYTFPRSDCPTLENERKEHEKLCKAHPIFEYTRSAFREAYDYKKNIGVPSDFLSPFAHSNMKQNDPTPGDGGRHQLQKCNALSWISGTIIALGSRFADLEKIASLESEALHQSTRHKPMRRLTLSNANASQQSSSVQHPTLAELLNNAQLETEKRNFNDVVKKMTDPENLSAEELEKIQETLISVQGELNKLDEAVANSHSFDQ